MMVWICGMEWNGTTVLSYTTTRSIVVSQAEKKKEESHSAKKKYCSEQFSVQN